MKTPSIAAAAALMPLLALGCEKPAPVASDVPIDFGNPNFAAGSVGRPSVLVNPSSSDEGTAKTIQEGIDMVAPGGEVLVLPGTYPEALVIDKGLTLEALGAESVPVVVAPAGVSFAAVEVATPEPVTIRGLTVHARRSGISGIFGVAEDLTVERTTVLGNDPLGFGVLIDVVGDAPTGTRARLVVRESVLDGGISLDPSTPPAFPFLGIRAGGDVDARIEGNVIRRTGGTCIAALMRNDFSGELNVDIVNNDLDQCHARRAGAINVGPAIPRNPPFPAVTATGTVNIVGNTIRNSTGWCLLTTGIYYEFYAGRVERNRIDGVVQGCATANDRALPAGIWVGSLRGLPAAQPAVRFNDIVGNAQAGLRVASNITTALEATCNWWGSESGPSGAGTGLGDAIVVEAGAATPVFMPFPTSPIADTEATSC